MIHKNNAGALYLALEYHAGKEYSIEQELLNESDALSRMEKNQEWYNMAMRWDDFVCILCDRIC